MDSKHNRMILYSAQAKPVVEAIERDGVCYSKREYVLKKYHESAPIFTTVYDFFVSEAVKYAKMPNEAEYPYWAFKDLYSVDLSGGGALKLSVPTEEAIFFDVKDYNKVICLKYLGEDEKDERRFKQKIEEYGIKKEIDIMLTNFYPDLKQEVLESWKRLFRYDKEIKAGNYSSVESVQACLWRIKKEWIISE